MASEAAPEAHEGHIPGINTGIVPLDSEYRLRCLRFDDLHGRNGQGSELNPKARHGDSGELVVGMVREICKAIIGQGWTGRATSSKEAARES